MPVSLKRINFKSFMRTLLKPFRLVYVIYSFLLFVGLMIPVFIWSLMVLPLGRIRGGNLIYRACMLWGDIWYFLIFIRHRNIYEGPKDYGHGCIFICNHNSYLDVPAIVKTFRHPLRPLGKAEMAKVPIFGTIYKNAIVTVDRGNATNRAKSVHILKSVLKRNISILVFPEGTFNESSRPLKEFYDGAFRIAIQTGAPIRPVLMLDNTDRLHWKSLFTLNPGRSRSVFLPEIPTEGYSLQTVSVLKEKVYRLMEEKLIEYGAGWIN